MHSLGATAPITFAASPFGGGPIVPDQVAINEARIAATELLQTSLKRFNAKGNTFVGEGMPDDDILRQAARLPAGLIVVGSLGRTGIRRVALGSVAETIARKAACSVLIVRLADNA